MTVKRKPATTFWCMIDDGRGFTDVEAPNADAARRRFQKSDRMEDWRDTGQPPPKVTVATLAEAIRWSVTTKGERP